MKDKIIVSESARPIFQLIIAAVFFTFAVGLIINSFYEANWEYNGFKILVTNIEHIALLLAFGAGFCSQKRVYIDLKNNRFKPSFEVGPIKLGKWATIDNPEYISVFGRLKQDGSLVYEVNLWYDTNKHFELFERNSIKDAYNMGYDISEELKIDLLDATISNDYKWIDKETYKKTGKIEFLD